MKINEITVQSMEISDRVGVMKKTNSFGSTVDLDFSKRVGVMNSTSHHHKTISVDQTTKMNVSTKLNILDLPPVVKVDESVEMSPNSMLNLKTSITNSVGSSKLKKFSILLVQDNIDLDSLKKISWVNLFIFLTKVWCSIGITFTNLEIFNSNS
jgi:hypothetical protein